jgi:hypothetical protein
MVKNEHYSCERVRFNGRPENGINDVERGLMLGFHCFEEIDERPSDKSVGDWS